MVLGGGQTGVQEDAEEHGADDDEHRCADLEQARAVLLGSITDMWQIYDI